jgi:hypothetical protein
VHKYSDEVVGGESEVVVEFEYFAEGLVARAAVLTVVDFAVLFEFEGAELESA